MIAGLAIQTQWWRRWADTSGSTRYSCRATRKLCAATVERC